MAVYRWYGQGTTAVSANGLQSYTVPENGTMGLKTAEAGDPPGLAEYVIMQVDTPTEDSVTVDIMSDLGSGSLTAELIDIDGENYLIVTMPDGSVVDMTKALNDMLLDMEIDLDREAYEIPLMELIPESMGGTGGSTGNHGGEIEQEQY